MAHPVRPNSYVEINNFYTVTIYEKGAEVVRMQHSLVGREGFAKGMKLYFERHDGHAVTCDDFVQAVADANPLSPLAQHLAQFKRWYSQAGTPSARAVKRIEDVRVLRTVQFAEDAGPMAHPVRPDSYLEINNFYTVTIYEKGAEVVRMMHTLVGREGFAKGMALYFARHDGQAVTCDDFAQAIADANPGSELSERLEQFKRWYSQAGTPQVAASGVYDADAKTYTLTLRQSCAPTPGQPEKLPFVIPVEVGLLTEDGAAQTVQLLDAAGMAGSPADTRLLVLTEAEQRFVFSGVTQPAVPSLLRGFTAPVSLQYDYSDDALLTLLAQDSDAFNRWEAGQRLALRIALGAINNPAVVVQANGEIDQNLLPAAFVEAMRSVLRHPTLDAAYKELVLSLPSESYLSEQLEEVDPQRVHAVRETLRQQLAAALREDWAWAWENHQDTGAYKPDPISSGRRALTGVALAMLCLDARRTGDAVWPGRAYQAFKDAANMTDRMAALSALVHSGHPLAGDALARFHALFKTEALVLDKWFALQAGATDRGGQVLPAVKQLMKHPDFQLQNPNRARSVIFSFCSANPGAFHRLDAAGYLFWSERVIELDAINPQVAARLARALDRWKKLAEPYRTAAREAIARVAARPDLSNDVREVVTRALAD